MTLNRILKLSIFTILIYGLFGCSDDSPKYSEQQLYRKIMNYDKKEVREFLGKPTLTSGSDMWIYRVRDGKKFVWDDVLEEYKDFYVKFGGDENFSYVKYVEVY